MLEHPGAGAAQEQTPLRSHGGWRQLCRTEMTEREQPDEQRAEEKAGERAFPQCRLINGGGRSRPALLSWWTCAAARLLATITRYLSRDRERGGTFRRRQLAISHVLFPASHFLLLTCRLLCFARVVWRWRAELAALWWIWGAGWNIYKPVKSFTLSPSSAAWTSGMNTRRQLRKQSSVFTRLQVAGVKIGGAVYLCNLGLH